MCDPTSYNRHEIMPHLDELFLITLAANNASAQNAA